MGKSSGLHNFRWRVAFLQALASFDLATLVISAANETKNKNMNTV
jgi:hypothetical protein